MDHEELDALARRLAQPATRRAGLAALLAGLLGLTKFAGETEAGKKAKRRRKRRKPPTTVRCNTSADCPIKGQDCLFGACTCLLDMKPVSPCGDVCCKDGERCHEGVCLSACRLPLRSGGDYTACDFSGERISGDLTSVSLRYANLIGAQVTASLRSVDFQYADLTNATLIPPEMANVSFQNASLDLAFLKPGAITGSVNFEQAFLGRFTWIEPANPPVRPTDTISINFNNSRALNYVYDDWDTKTRFILSNDEQGTYRHSFRSAQITRGDFSKSNMLDVTFVKSWWAKVIFTDCVNIERVEEEYNDWLWRTFAGVDWP